MKEYYAKAGIPTARYHLVDTLENGLAFAKEVGYPVIVKPDNGVGANSTFKLKNEEQLREFYASGLEHPVYHGGVCQRGDLLLRLDHRLERQPHL